MSVSYQDFPNICRLCLHNGDLQHFTQLEKWNLFKMITNIEVTENDMLPKNVCKICFNRLEDIFLFINRCRDNDALLKKICEEVKEENVIKIEILNDSDLDSDNNYEYYDVDQVEETLNKSEAANKENTNFTITPYNGQIGLEGNEFLKPKDSKIQSCSVYVIDVSPGGLNNDAKCRLDDYRCPICEKIFFPKRKLTLHLKSHQSDPENDPKNDLKNDPKNDTSYECPTCSKKFSVAEHLRRHALLHEGVKPFICNICEKGFLRKKSLIEHMVSHTGKMPYICSYCGKGYRSRSTLDYHIYHNHDVTKEETPKHKRKYVEKRVHLNLQCTICGKIFASRSGFANHQLSHKGVKKFLCNICGRNFITNAALEAHIRTHTGEKPFECKECGEKFSLRQSLNLHMSHHTTDKSLNCPHCDKRCYSKNSLTIHISTHSRDKFTCPDCDKQFLHKHAFHNHILNHKCDISHECNICEKKFARQSHLDEHVRIHTGEKPFRCTNCGKRLTNRRTLKTHMRLHTGETPYECSVCQKGYRDASNLRKHFKRHHVPDTKLGKTVLKTNDDTSKSPVI